MAIKLKEGYAGVIIGFNNSSKPLGQRSEADLNFLYQRAKEKNFSHWLEMFEEAPSEKEIDEVKEKDFNKKRNKKRTPDEK